MQGTTGYKVYAPLSDFRWTGENFLEIPGIEIRRRHQAFDLQGLDEGLSDSQKNELFYADHWLVFDSHTSAKPSPSEMVNLFLLSLWLARATKANVQFRFEVNQDPTDNTVGTTWIYKDTFSWVPETVSNEVVLDDLRKTADFFATMHSLVISDRRLDYALFLTYAGCVAHNWAVALVCFCSAAEALLTYSTGRGLTRRLAKSFACLTETEKSKRDQAYKEFSETYSVRSDVTHGRLYLRSDLDRLNTLARFEDVLRKLWKVVLNSHVSVLEGDDLQRQTFFEQLQAGYSPPT